PRRWAGYRWNLAYPDCSRAGKGPVCPEPLVEKHSRGPGSFSRNLRTHECLGGISRPLRRSIEMKARSAIYEIQDLSVARPDRRSGPALKRPFDMVLSGAGLLGSAPLWAMIALSIKFEDRGPVFYGHERVGKDGTRFTAWKFRSMIPDSDRAYAALQAAENDHRITRVGRLLRATAMDELPQLWNIFKGDMSLVGPRALQPGEVEVRGDGTLVRLQDIPGYRERHRVRPGLTGLTQVYAPRDISRTSKFRLDRLYLKRAGFWLDLKLILVSFWITGRGEWETRARRVVVRQATNGRQARRT